MAPAAAMEQMMRDMSLEDMKKEMAIWESWMNENKTFLVDGGDPLGKTKQVTPSGIVDVKNEIGGYTIVQAESHEAAARLFGPDHPHFNLAGATIDVMEIVPMPVAE